MHPEPEKICYTTFFVRSVLNRWTLWKKGFVFVLEKKVEGSLREVWCQMIFETFYFLFQGTWYIYTSLMHTLHCKLNNDKNIIF